MTTTHHLTGDLRDVLGDGAKGVVATLHTNLGDAALVDLDANVVHLPGPKRIPLSGTTFDIEPIATNSTGTNVEGDTLRYQVWAQYVDAANVRKTWSSPWFTLTADADLSDKVTDEYLPATPASALLEQMEAIRDETETIAGLTGEDEAVALLVADAGSDTAAALDAKIAEEAAEAIRTATSLPVGPDGDAHVFALAGGTTAKTVLSTDTKVAVQSTGLGTPVWSDSLNTWVAQPVTLGGQDMVRILRLDVETLAETQNMRLTTSSHDTWTGHRVASVATSREGTVVSHGGTHGSGATLRHSTSPRDLQTMAVTTVPTGLDTMASYRRFFRNPYTGDLWLGVRGNGYRGRLFKWANSTKTWTPIAVNPLTVDTHGSYGMELAFGPDGTMYVSCEWRYTADGTSGYPRAQLGGAKSTDGGATWTDLAGNPITGPLSPSNTTVLYHEPTGSTGASRYTGVVGRVGISKRGLPVFVAAWRHPSLDGSYRSLWATEVDRDGTFSRRRLLPALSNWNVGNPHLAYTPEGRIAVVASQRDDHLPATNDEVTSANYPDSPAYLFLTDDGLTWYRYTLDAGTAGLGVSGGYIDPESLRLRNAQVRVLPNFSLTPTKSELWTVNLPARLAAAEDSPSTPTAAPSTPATAAQPALWLRPEDLTGNDGDIVATWTAFAGSNAVERTSGKGPTIVRRGINGRRAVRFTAASQQGLLVPGSWKWQNLTLLVVAKSPLTSGGSGQTLVSSDGGSGTRVTSALHSYLSNGQLTAALYTISGGQAVVGGAYNDYWQALGVRVEGTDGAPHTVRARIHPSFNATPVTTGNHTPTTAANLAIGGVGSAISSTIDIAEVMVFASVLSDADLTTWGNFLAAKHGL